MSHKTETSHLSNAYDWFSALEAEDFSRMDDLLARGVPVDVPHPLRHTTALMEATRLGRMEAVRWLLDHHASPAFLCGPALGTPIHCALRLHRWDIARELMKATVTSALADEHGRTPLHILASELGDCPNPKYVVELTSKIIEKGCPLDALDGEAITALHYAAVLGHTLFAELLLAHGANPNIAAPDTGVYPLTIAAIDQNHSLAALLLEYGADAALPMIDGQTPSTIFPPIASMLADMQVNPLQRSGRESLN